MASAQGTFKAGEARGTGEAKANQLMDSAKDIASSAAQTAREGMEQASGFMRQTGEQTKNMADNVKSTLGMGDNTSGRK